jgi:hypothetical protein
MYAASSVLTRTSSPKAPCMRDAADREIGDVEADCKESQQKHQGKWGEEQRSRLTGAAVVDGAVVGAVVEAGAVELEVGAVPALADGDGVGLRPQDLAALVTPLP